MMMMTLNGVKCDDNSNKQRGHHFGWSGSEPLADYANVSPAPNGCRKGDRVPPRVLLTRGSYVHRLKEDGRTRPTINRKKKKNAGRVSPGKIIKHTRKPRSSTRSLVRSVGRSVGRSLARSIDRPIVRSFLRLREDLCRHLDLSPLTSRTQLLKMIYEQRVLHPPGQWLVLRFHSVLIHPTLYNPSFREIRRRVPIHSEQEFKLRGGVERTARRFSLSTTSGTNVDP